MYIHKCTNKKTLEGGAHMEVTEVRIKKVNSGNKMKKISEKRNNKNIQKLIGNSIKGTNPFVESLNKVNVIYNKPIDILIDKNNLYLVEGEN